MTGHTAAASSTLRIPIAETSDRGLITHGPGTRSMNSLTSSGLINGTNSGTSMPALLLYIAIAILSRKIFAPELLKPGRQRCSRITAAVITSNSSRAITRSTLPFRDRNATRSINNAGPASLERQSNRPDSREASLHLAFLLRNKDHITAMSLALTNEVNAFEVGAMHTMFKAGVPDPTLGFSLTEVSRSQRGVEYKPFSDSWSPC